MSEARQAKVARRTSETDISLELIVDGQGRFHGETGIGFFDHMLEAFTRHGYFDLRLQVEGDLHVDGHHTVEDVGLCLGQALSDALGDRAGIRRFGSAWVPMDDALVLASLDLSGRPYLAYGLRPAGTCLLGTFDPALAQEFFRSVSVRAGMTLHLVQSAGDNDHHVIEAAFKAVGRALDQATGIDPRLQGVLSTKGAL